MTCPCPCTCPRTGQRDDDGTPGWCDPCRMNIHQYPREQSPVPRPVADVLGLLP